MGHLDIDEDIDDFADIDALLLHDRTYRVRAYREGPGRMRLRGMVRDRKPAGLYIPGDPLPLVAHHMVVDLLVSIPDLVIVEARAVLETHPHTLCPRIEDHYANLVGLEIARGFTHRVRELFGGPRGCTHVTALLQAMAPAALQAMTSVDTAPTDGVPTDGRALGAMNTCHVWAEDGPIVAAIRRGEPPERPIWLAPRERDLGIAPVTWPPQPAVG